MQQGSWGLKWKGGSKANASLSWSTWLTKKKVPHKHELSSRIPKFS